MRIVSLLPGVTELIYQLGLGTSVVGRGADCTLPAEARLVPVVGRQHSAAQPGLGTPLVEGAPAHAHVAGYDLYRAALAAVAPEVIVLTETCPVCAAAYGPASSAGAGVSAATGRIGSAPVRLISVAPGRLDTAVGLIAPLAAELGQPERGATLFKTRAARLLALRMHVARFLVLSGAARPGVALVTAPASTGDSMPWLPDMVDAAGGIPIPGTGVAEDAFGSPPDVLLFGAIGAASEPDVEPIQRLVMSDGWRDLPAVQRGRAWLVHLDPDFTHYGPRLIEGVETLVRIVLPQALGANGTPPAPHLARRLE